MKDKTNHPINFSYTQEATKTWTWKLVDKDLIGEEFAAALELTISLAKVEQQGKRYWIITDLLASPQSIKGFPLEISLLQVNYKEEKATLAMELDIQFKLSATNIDKHLDTGIGNDITREEQQQLIKALFGAETGVQAGFSMKHVWTSNNILPQSTPVIARKFLLMNENNALTINKIASNKSAVIENIDDPGMDGLFGGKADWEVRTNEETFCQPL